MIAPADWEPPSPPTGAWVRRDAEWLLRLEGTYATGNDRGDASVGSANRTIVPAGSPALDPADLSTPTTPCLSGAELDYVEPTALQRLGDASRPDPSVERVEFLWRGRVVHRAQSIGDEWDQRNADHWDNCVDPRFTPPASSR